VADEDHPVSKLEYLDCQWNEDQYSR